MKKKLFISLALCIPMCLCLLGGCGDSGDSANVPTPPALDAEVQTNDSIEAEPEEAPDGMARSYLTGEWIDEELAGKRPIAMMIENTLVCLPQYGINNADIIYECPVEGGISRLLGIYQDYSGMEQMGNVRSSRPYYVYFAREYDAIYVHAGGSVEAYDILDTGFINDIDAIKGGGASEFFRTKEHKAPHNLYISSENIENAINNLAYETNLEEGYEGHFCFAKDDTPTQLSNGVDAAVVKVYYPNPKPWFVYNEEDGLYYRNQFNSSQVDAITGEQVAVKNIIIEECAVSYYDQNKGYLNVDITSGGSGKYITNGKCIDITWSKESDTAPTRYYDKDGKEIVLNQGKTWVAVTQDSYSDRNVIYATLEEYESSK